MRSIRSPHFCIRDSVISVRTTLDLDDSILKKANQRAVEEGKTLTRVLEDALRRYLEPAPDRATTFKLRLLTKKGRLLPGANISDRDSLYEQMDGSTKGASP